MKHIVWIICLLFSSWASAQEGANVYPTERVMVKGLGVIPYQKLFEEKSLPNETLDMFVSRISHKLVAFSDATGFEACGVIGEQSGRFGVVIGTSHSHVACANFSKYLPDGMRSTGQTVHSHGTGAAKLNATDLLFMGIPVTSRSIHMYGKTWGQERDQFSSQDLKAGSGYLAHPKGVLHHHQGVIRALSN